MDEIKIDDTPEEIKIEPEPLKEEEIKIEKLSNEGEKGLDKPIAYQKVSEEKEVQKAVPKKFLYLIGIIIFIFIAFLAFNFISQSTPTGNIITIDELFQKNLQGDLPEEQGYFYNEFSFVFFDGLWYTEVQPNQNTYQVPLHFGPKDLENISIKGKLDDRFQKGDVYLTFNPLTSDDFLGVAIGEISQSVSRAIGRKPIGACDRNETTSCQNRPIINCTNTDQAVIFFSQEPGPEIELKGNCLIIKGQEYDIVKAADRVLMQWYKIMD